MPPSFLRTPRPPYLLYYYFAGSLGGALLLTVVMVILGFLFSAVALAFVVLGGDFVPAVASIRGRLAGITPSYPLGLAIYPVLAYLFVWLPLKKRRETGLSSVRTV